MITYPDFSDGQDLGLTSSTESLTEGAAEVPEAHSSGGLDFSRLLEISAKYRIQYIYILL